MKNWRFDECASGTTKKDTMLYALGIGLGQDPEDTGQLRYVYEKDLQAFPTLSVVLGYPVFWVRDPRAGIDWVKVVHGEQRLTVHAPLPARSGVVTGKSRNTHVIDKGRGQGRHRRHQRTLPAGRHLPGDPAAKHFLPRRRRLRPRRCQPPAPARRARPRA